MFWNAKDIGHCRQHHGIYRSIVASSIRPLPHDDIYLKVAIRCTSTEWRYLFPKTNNSWFATMYQKKERQASPSLISFSYCQAFITQNLRHRTFALLHSSLLIITKAHAICFTFSKLKMAPVSFSITANASRHERESTCLEKEFFFSGYTLFSHLSDIASLGRYYLVINRKINISLYTKRRCVQDWENIET